MKKFIRVTSMSFKRKKIVFSRQPIYGINRFFFKNAFQLKGFIFLKKNKQNIVIYGIDPVKYNFYINTIKY